MKEWITEDGLTQIEQWASEGLSERRIAVEKMHISATTMVDYKKKYPNILNALKKGQSAYLEKLKEQTETALDDLCKIQWLEEHEIYETRDAYGNVTSSTKKIKRRQVLPNVTAVIFRAKKLMPEKYGDHIEALDDSTIEEWHNEIAEAIRNGDDDS